MHQVEKVWLALTRSPRGAHFDTLLQELGRNWQIKCKRQCASSSLKGLVGLACDFARAYLFNLCQGKKASRFHAHVVRLRAGHDKIYESFLRVACLKSRHFLELLLPTTGFLFLLFLFQLKNTN